MNTIMTSFILESKRQLNKKSLWLFLFFTLLSLYFVQNGINNYANTVESKGRFLDIEKMKVEQYATYGQYGTYGFRVLFIPSPLSIFFINSSTVSELTSNVDSGERLNIYNSFKGETLFTEKSGGFKDFSGIMLLLGSLLVLYFGYESRIHKDYLRFLSSFSSRKKLFASILFAQFGLLSIFFLSNTGLSLLLLKANGISLDRTEWIRFIAYNGILLLMMMFFLLLGSIAGSFKSRFTGFITVIVVWFALVFLVPGIVGAITYQKADNIVSNYHLELQKLKKLMTVEKRMREKTGSSEKRNPELVKELMEVYWDNEFRDIQRIEKKLEREMEKNIRHYQTLASYFPSTFYLSTSDEVSSKGYENFIRFYSYIQELKVRFVRFYLDKRFWQSPNVHPAKIESFIKTSENLFDAQSRLPKNFGTGILITILYISLLMIISYIMFVNSLKL
jgi:hypothetical protein